ncbi:hypothetical protein SprV_0802609200 [Sparganum proliferum]
MHPQREAVADGGLEHLIDDAAKNYGRVGKAIGSATLEIDDNAHTAEEEKEDEEDLAEEADPAEGGMGGELDGTIRRLDGCHCWIVREGGHLVQNDAVRVRSRVGIARIQHTVGHLPELISLLQPPGMRQEMLRLDELQRK